MVHLGEGLAARAMGAEAVVHPAIAPLFAPGLALDNASGNDAVDGEDSFGRISQLIPHTMVEGVLHHFAGLPQNSFLKRTMIREVTSPELAVDEGEDDQRVIAHENSGDHSKGDRNDPLSPLMQSTEGEVKLSNITIHLTEERFDQQYQPLLPTVPSPMVDLQANQPTFLEQFSKTSDPEFKPSLFSESPSSQASDQPLSLSTPGFSSPKPQSPPENLAARNQHRGVRPGEVRAEIRPHHSNLENSSDLVTTSSGDSQPSTAPSRPQSAHLVEETQPLRAKSQPQSSAEKSEKPSSLRPTLHQLKPNLAIHSSVIKAVGDFSTPGSPFSSTNDSEIVQANLRETILLPQETAIALPVPPASTQPPHSILSSLPEKILTPISPQPQTFSSLASISPQPQAFSSPGSTATPPLPPSLPPPSTIQITIGRIEIRTTPRPTPARSTAPPKPQVSLQDYLKQRNQTY